MGCVHTMLRGGESHIKMGSPRAYATTSRLQLIPNTTRSWRTTSQTSATTETSSTAWLALHETRWSNPTSRRSLSVATSTVRNSRRARTRRSGGLNQQEAFRVNRRGRAQFTKQACRRDTVHIGLPIRANIERGHKFTRCARAKAQVLTDNACALRRSVSRTHHLQTNDQWRSAVSHWLLDVLQLLHITLH